jgi:hypothetical protein
VVVRSRRVDRLRASISPNASDVRVSDRDGHVELTYRLLQDTTDAALASVYALVIAEGGHLQLGIYVDHEVEVATAYEVVASCTWSPR